MPQQSKHDPKTVTLILFVLVVVIVFLSYRIRNTFMTTCAQTGRTEVECAYQYRISR